MWKVRFVLVLLSSSCSSCSSLLSFFSSCITQKLYGVYKWSAHQMTALLSEMFLLWFRAACELRWASYLILCIPTRITQKLEVVYRCSTYWMTSLLSEIHIFWLRAACEIQLASYGSKHALQSLSDTLECILTCITWKLQVVYEHFTYQTTALLSEMSIFWVRAPCEIQLASYDSKHASQSAFDMPFACTYMYMHNLKLQVVYWRSAYI